LNSGHKLRRLDGGGAVLAEFEQICRVDLRLKEGTINNHLTYIKRYLEFCKKQALEVDSSQSIRDFLSSIRDGNQNTYANNVKALRVFFRECLQSDTAKRFKIPRSNQGYAKVPSKEELGRFYNALPDWRSKALFLFYASSGRRRNEILNLALKDVDFEQRTLRPMAEESQTKHTWFSFFNEEAVEAYRRYGKEEGTPANGNMFEGASHLNQVFRETSGKTGVKITPQMLRKWFCSEMLSKGVQEVYVDAYCGRVPKSVLGRHYTDFSPEKLKEIYDKANIKVLL